jgi:hypothetical protein
VSNVVQEGFQMMDGGMGSMMGWMMGFGWLAALAILALVIAGIVLFVNVLAGRDRTAQPPTAGISAARLALVALAVIGGIAFVAATAMTVMGCCTFG